MTPFLCRPPVALSLGFPFALSLIDHPAGPDRKVAQIPRGFLSKPGVEVYSGVAYSLDGRLLYVSTGDSGAVDIVATRSWRRMARIGLNGMAGGHNYKESFAAGLVLSANGKTLYVIDEANWRIVVIDTSARTRLAPLTTGVNPIALCLSPDNKRLYIANSGLFEYKTIPGADSADRLHTGLHFPPFGYPSLEAQNGTLAEGKAIPGIDDANDPRGSSLWTYDVNDLSRVGPAASLRLGAPIDAVNTHVVGGAAPSAVAASENAVYVALAHEDAVAVISADGQSLKAQIPLTPFSGPGLWMLAAIRCAA